MIRPWLVCTRTTTALARAPGFPSSCDHNSSWCQASWTYGLAWRTGGSPTLQPACLWRGAWRAPAGGRSSWRTTILTRCYGEAAIARTLFCAFFRSGRHSQSLRRRRLRHPRWICGHLWPNFSQAQQSLTLDEIVAGLAQPVPQVPLTSSRE